MRKRRYPKSICPWPLLHALLALTFSSFIILTSSLPEANFDAASTAQAVLHRHHRHRMERLEKTTDILESNHDSNSSGNVYLSNYKSDPTSAENELSLPSNGTTLDDLNLPGGFWIKVAQAKVMAIAVENETLPRLDELPQIMKPGSCREEGDSHCKRLLACITKAATSLEEKLHQNGTNSSMEELPTYIKGILTECEMAVPQSLMETENPMNLFAPVDIPRPMPFFHCNTHMGLRDEHRNFLSNFRMEYHDTISPPKNMSRDLIPRYFVIEKEQNGHWIVQEPIQYYWLFRFGTKLHETFRIRVTALSPKYIYPPVLSPSVTLYEPSKPWIMKPTNLRILNITVDAGAARPSPSALLRWSSGSGLNASCDFDVYAMDEDMYKVERTKGDDAFWVKLEKLHFDRNYQIKVIEKFGGGLESEIVTNLDIPSCLELRGFSFDLCPPPPPSKVRLANATDSSFWIVWDPPKYMNATNRILTYNVTVDWIYTPSADGIMHGASYNMHPVFRGNVPGNVSQLEVKNVTNLNGKFRVSVKAISASGSSVQNWDFLYYKGPASNTWNARKILILFFALFGVILLVALFCVFKNFHERRQRKKKRQEKFENYEKESYHLPQIDRDASKWEIDCCSITLGDPIGQGNFGLVRKATLSRKGRKITVAVKTLRDDVDDKDVSKFWEEFEILKNLDPHVHVLGLKGIVTKHVPLPLLVVEFCDGGDLQTHLRKAFHSNGLGRKYSPSSTVNSGGSSLTPSNSENRVQVRIATNEAYFMQQEIQVPQLSMGDLLSYARQVACGMEYLSTNKIVHRDLAARNILLVNRSSSNGSGKTRIIKIADFGLSRDVYEQNWYKKSSKGNIPIKWLAIESLLKEVYTTESDVWSYGILLWEIFTYGGIPYPGVENNKMFDLLRDGYRMPKPEHCPDDLYELMRSCWEDEPCDRPDFTSVRLILEDIIEKITQVTYLNLESGIGSTCEDDGSSVEEPILPPLRKKPLPPIPSHSIPILPGQRERGRPQFNSLY